MYYLFNILILSKSSFFCSLTKSGSLIFKNPVKDVVDNTQQQKEVVKPQNNGNSIYDQMNSLMRNSIIDALIIHNIKI